MRLKDPRPYHWPTKGKIKTYEVIRAQGRRVVEFGTINANVFFRLVWQTPYGRTAGRWCLITEAVPNLPTTTYASIIEADYQELKLLTYLRSYDRSEIEKEAELPF